MTDQRAAAGRYSFNIAKNGALRKRHWVSVEEAAGTVPSHENSNGQRLTSAQRKAQAPTVGG